MTIDLEIAEAIAAPAQSNEDVYFVKCVDFVKIGYTRNMKNRLLYLSVGNPFPIELIDKFNWARRVEPLLHRKFKHLSLGGRRSEWFHYGEEIAEFIDLHAGRGQDRRDAQIRMAAAFQRSSEEGWAKHKPGKLQTRQPADRSSC